ncbi:GntR family transcriptional regulator [Labrys miyagiensis]|uniref:GntR family transcriptional regulator n=1 Tax=Labrys miyagiensis TaxID=346912 RepID=A0ABQ6CVF7_9HYPH|nr:GntR family transcriptional regulator [Labrys miyagiensis]GLS22251.1 GntR family transcriptional regulator [Labrys miyagiensis]
MTAPSISFTPNFEHRNLADQCADHIVLLIASGELQPGQRVFEKDICARLGVSRVPVREAFRILQAQGVIATEPNRGSFVNEFGSVETAELLEVRLSVERLALRRFSDRVAQGETELGILETAIDAMRRAARLNDQLSYCQADLAFHQKIVELSQSHLLVPLWASLSRGVLVFLMQERNVLFDYQESIEEHVYLVELIRSGRQAALDREIERHIISNVRRKAHQVDAVPAKGSAAS